MKRRFSLFTYPVMDMKAAEAELNRRAAAGWRLERLWLGLLASFVPAEEPVCYCIDWADPNLGDGWDYAALLAEAGWRLKSQVTYRMIYEAPAGTTPIQTDSELEYRRFRKKVLRRMLIACGVLAAYLLFLLTLGLATGAEGFRWTDLAHLMAFSNTLAVILLTLPILTAGILAWLLRMGLRLWQWRRAAREGEPFPVPGQISANLAALCVLLGWLYALSLLFPAVLDILDGKISIGWGIGLVIGVLLRRKIYPAAVERERWFLPAALAAAAAVIVLPLLAPPGLTAPLYPRDPMAEARLLTGEDTWYVRHQGLASLLASYTRWEEGAADSSAWLEGQCWHIRSDFLAGRLAAEYLEELGLEHQAPLTGYDQVWMAPEALRYANGNTADLWLLRRGDVIVRLETTPDLLEEQDLGGILSQLEGSQ